MDGVGVGHGGDKAESSGDEELNEQDFAAEVSRIIANQRPSSQKPKKEPANGTKVVKKQRSANRVGPNNRTATMRPEARGAANYSSMTWSVKDRRKVELGGEPGKDMHVSEAPFTTKSFFSEKEANELASIMESVYSSGGSGKKSQPHLTMQTPLERVPLIGQQAQPDRLAEQHARQSQLDSKVPLHQQHAWLNQLPPPSQHLMMPSNAVSDGSTPMAVVLHGPVAIAFPHFQSRGPPMYTIHALPPF
eukprot:913687-Pyramimonas_sp.AAC.1